MTAALPRMLERIAADEGLGSVDSLVRRADFDKRGRLVVELDSDRGSRWFRSNGDRLRELRPEGDRKLPLARWLAEARRPPHLIAWRPGRRMVLAREADADREVWKGHRPKRLSVAARRHRLAHALCSAGDAFAVPELIGVDRARATLRLARVDGFEPRIRSADATDFELIGRCLRRFQDAGRRVALAGDDALDSHDARAELAILDDRGRRCTLALGHRPPGFDLVAARLASAPPPEHPKVPCHRDLHDGQILLGGGSPTLLDFDLLCLGDPVLDVANLLAHLALRRLQGLAGATPDGVRACGDALLAGIDRGDQPQFLGRLRFYQATALLRLAALYALRPRWSALSNDLVRLADRCADEVLPARTRCSP